MEPTDLLDTIRLATELQFQPQSIRVKRLNGSGPKFIKIGNRVRYLWSDVLTWLEENRHSSTCELNSSKPVHRGRPRDSK